MKADEFLENHGIDFELVEQEEPTTGCDEAAEARGLETFQIVKSLILENDGKLLHACIPGDRTLSERKFGEHRLVDPEKSKELTGQESGTVHPFSSDLKHVIDERVFEKERISFTIGTKTEGVVLRPEDFRKALEEEGIEYEVRDIVVVNDRDIEELESKGAGTEESRFLAEKGYRREFFELKDFGVEEAVNVLGELDRHETDFRVEEARELVEVSEGETHLQKLVKHFADTGEIREDTEDFELEETVKKVVDENPEAVEDYRDGKDSAINYLMGEVMKRTNGRADGGEARKIILEQV